jgi:hypothetical protein
MKPGECDVYYPGGTVPGQMGWIKFLAISSSCGLVEKNKKLAFPAQHAYSRPSSMRTMAFLTFPRAVSSLASWLATCGIAPPMSEPGIVMTFSAGISATFVFFIFFLCRLL